MKNKKIIYYSGPYNINALGATRSIDIPILENFKNIGIKTIWIGCGKFNVADKNYNLEPSSRLIQYWIKVKNKLLRDFFLQSEQIQALNRYIEYDLLTSDLLKNNKQNIDHNSIMISRSVAATVSFKTAKKLGVKTILHSSWCHPLYQRKLLSEHFKKLKLKLEPVLAERVNRQIEEINTVDKIWCISNMVLESYLEFGVPREKLFLCPLGVDLNRYKFDNLKQSEKFCILHVGNVNPEKGVHLLFQALKKTDLSNIKIIFNGAIPDYFSKIFYKMCTDLKINKNISIEVSPGVPDGNYQKADLFILPSIHESFGLVVLEAMANGLPVIISDNVGSIDCIINGENASTFENGNVDQLANLIQKHYLDRNFRLKIGQKAKKDVKKYSWEIVSKMLLEKVLD